jgi:hypothetical protein
LIHHSDAGSQYTSFRLAAHLAGQNIAASIGTVGDALDNALMESTIGLYKTELIKRRGPWRTLTDVELGTAERGSRAGEIRADGSRTDNQPYTQDARDPDQRPVARCRPARVVGQAHGSRKAHIPSVSTST